jgi:chromosomal replication initiation ATPase DnaA
VLTGPPGAGKTHLAQIWAAANRGARASSPHAGRRAAVLLPAGRGGVVIDNAEAHRRNPGEEALFHLHNHLQATRGALLLTARARRATGAAAARPASRLAAATHVALEPPDDALLAAVLVKLFNDRQIRVSPQLIDFLLARIERSLAQARTRCRGARCAGAGAETAGLAATCGKRKFLPRVSTTRAEARHHGTVAFS